MLYTKLWLNGGHDNIQGSVKQELILCSWIGMRQDSAHIVHSTGMILCNRNGAHVALWKCKFWQFWQGRANGSEQSSNSLHFQFHRFFCPSATCKFNQCKVQGTWHSTCMFSLVHYLLHQESDSTDEFQRRPLLQATHVWLQILSARNRQRATFRWLRSDVYKYYVTIYT